MDVISHWLWGMAVTHGKIKGRFSGTMGVIPDLMAFLPVMIISLSQETVTCELMIQLQQRIFTLFLGRYTNGVIVL